ncbi:MAG: 3-hydroxyacyl-CoA dehydrogenase [Rhodocyclaceae bacterium]|nr:3-hydroxyacyl-CoA dehydrogenase [Rhodocyclaceae bacterium]
MRIDGNVFLVTGGASGLGAGTVRYLAARGARIMIADVDRARGEALSSEIGSCCRFFATDVVSETDMKACLEATRTAFGALHGLIHCAGIVMGEKTLGKEGPHRLESFRRVIEVNLIGAFNAIRLSAEAMAANAPNEEGERGVIIATASIAAYEGQIGQAAYAAAKGGVIAMILPIARDLARYGIRVLSIAPGIFQTPMMEGMAPEIQESLAKMVPFPPRLGRPEEFASLVTELIENAYLNGETIRLDGAIRMQPK